MSEATRAIALANAVAIHGGKADAATVLETAESLHSFLMGDAVQAASQPKAATKAATKPTTAKPVKAKPQPELEPEPEPEVEDDAPADGDDGVTKEACGEALTALLEANLRTQALALFKKHGASSMGSLSPAKYAAFVVDAENLLLTG
jgi:hypothetical protein